MATSNNPLAPNPETDIDSAEIHDIPLRDLETGEEEDPKRKKGSTKAWSLRASRTTATAPAG
jgi:hypothetical protein